jgi:hypothetical protein
MSENTNTHSDKIKSNGSRSPKDKLSSNSIKSKKSDKQIEIESEDISLSQLEMMANKKKLNKKSIEMSIKETSTSDKDKDNVSKKSRSSKQYKEHKEHKRDEEYRKKEVSSITLSSSANSHDHRKEKAKLVNKENRIDSIRMEKSEFLYKFNKLNANGKFSSLKLDMNNSLDEIRNEYERIKNEIQTDRSVAFFKRMLLLGVQGVEMLNTRFDPLGVDLDGWSESMGYSLENQEYDEVMAELYEKYKGKGQMSPEMKMIFMIISSATMFTITKKITKMESSNPFKNFIGNFVGGNQVPQMSQMPQMQQMPQHYQETYVTERQTESTDEGGPSKMNDPNLNGDINLNDILKKMNEKKQEKERELQKKLETESSDDLFKSIQLSQGKKRGRPRKANPSLKGL